MYIAMNRFKVIPEEQHAFMQRWLTRDSQLRQVPGFVSFELLRGPVAEDHVLYASHTVWRSYVDFEAWTRSEQFRKAHAQAGDGRKLTIGHPNFEGFETVEELSLA
ncbi:MAG: antibiotic biosynthesis monooxygenase [Rhodospirillales bacterium]